MSEQTMTPQEVLAVLDEAVRMQAIFASDEPNWILVRAAVAELAQQNEAMKESVHHWRRQYNIECENLTKCEEKVAELAQENERLKGELEVSKKRHAYEANAAVTAEAERDALRRRVEELDRDNERMHGFLEYVAGAIRPWITAGVAVEELKATLDRAIASKEPTT